MFDCVDFKEVVRVGRSILVHVDIEYFKVVIFMVSFDSILFDWVVFRRLVLVLELTERDATVHL